MGSEPNTPTKKGGSMNKWTDKEKLAFVFNLFETQCPGPICWKKVRIPPGRTLKACMHVYQNMKDSIKSELEIYKSAQSSNGGNESQATTPKKTRGRKRKIDEDGGNASQTPKGRKAAKTTVSDDEDCSPAKGKMSNRKAAMRDILVKEEPEDEENESTV